MAKPKTHSPNKETTAGSPQDVEASLSTIFRDEQGELPDLTKLEQRKSRRWLTILIGLGGFVLILIVAAWVGFLLFNPFRGFQGKGLDISIDGPEHILLGEETTYFINWKNSSSDPIANASLRVSFPTDFSLTSVDPQPTGQGLVWDIESIPFGGRGTFTIKGAFTGALGTKTAIQAVGTFRPASFNSDFETLSTRAIEYTDTVLGGIIDAPQKAMPGDKIRIVYTIQNRGLSPVRGLGTRITLPEGFIREATSTLSTLDERVVRMPIGELVPGASSTVTLIGTFASGHAGEAVVYAETGRIGSDGTFQAAQKTDATVIVLSGDLTLKLVANGSDANQTVGFGDMLRMSIGFENTATEPITGVSIRLRLDPLIATGTAPFKKGVTPVFVDWSRLEDSASGTVSGNTDTWDASRVGLLDRLSPQQDGTIDVSLPVIRSATSSLIGFQAVVEGVMKSVGETVVNRTIRSAPISFRFRSDANISSQARYFSEEGAPLGTGPLPPVVGQTTRYRIEWTLAKTIHELKNIRVTAMLPKRVAWPGRSTVSAGDIAFDGAGRVVTWTLNRLPADVGEAFASFDIDLTPSDFDAGRFADLLGDTRFEATDADISEQIIKSTLPLTTDLANDEGAKSKGVVRK